MLHYTILYYVLYILYYTYIIYYCSTSLTRKIKGGLPLLVRVMIVLFLFKHYSY